MKRLLNIKTYVIVCFCVTSILLHSLAFADKSLDPFGIEMPPNTKLKTGNIDGIQVDNIGNGIIIINDQVFRVSHETRYYNSNKKRISLKTFENYLYVGYEVNDQFLLALWPEENTEEDTPNSSFTPSSDDSDQSDVTNKNGVWKN